MDLIGLNDLVRKSDIKCYKLINLIITNNLNEFLCLYIIYEKSIPESSDVNILTKNNPIIDSNRRLAWNLIIIKSDLLKGRKKTTPTWPKFHSCTKG